MRVLITGATGFIGANVARQLIAQGEQVHILVREAASFWRLEDVREQLHVHVADVNNAPAVAAALQEIRPQAVYHLAAYGAYYDQRDTASILQTTLLGTWNLLRASKDADVQVFVNAGSSSEYGTKDHPMREDEVLDPNSFYAVGKAAQTHLCRQFWRAEGLPTITLRIFGAYGPYEDPNRLVPTLLSRALRNEPLPLAAPETPRDYIYVDDVVQAFLAAGARPDLGGEVLNLGTGQQSLLKDLVHTVLELAKSTSVPQWGAYPPRSFDPTVWVADAARLQERLGFRAQTDLRAGLERHIAWHRAHASLAQSHAV